MSMKNISNKIESNGVYFNIFIEKINIPIWKRNLNNKIILGAKNYIS